MGRTDAGSLKPVFAALVMLAVFCTDAHSQEDANTAGETRAGTFAAQQAQKSKDSPGASA